MNRFSVLFPVKKIHHQNNKFQIPGWLLAVKPLFILSSNFVFSQHLSEPTDTELIFIIELTH